MIQYNIVQFLLQRVIKKLKTGRSSLPSLVTYETLDEPESSQSEFCLFSKLLEIHHEECNKYTDEVNVSRTVWVLHWFFEFFLIGMYVILEYRVYLIVLHTCIYPSSFNVSISV